jgi:hypothetical protein
MRAGFNDYMGEGTVLAHLLKKNSAGVQTGFTSPQEFI